MHRKLAIPVATAALTLVGALLAPAAHAGNLEDYEVVVDGLVTPLSFAVADDGTVYAAQNFAGLLTKAAPGEDPEVIYADPKGREVGAISESGGVVTFATTGGTHKDPNAHLYTLTPGDEGYERTKVANLFKYEKQNNPDAANKYGFAGLKKSCKKKLPKYMKSYRGIIESHPYATALGQDGVTYVADAAGNTILEVSDTGAVSTLAVLPPVKTTVNKAAQQQYDLPKCVRGHKFKLEFVPTDVEMGPDGDLYVSALPGGPDDGSLGANGGVYRVDLPDGPMRAGAGAAVTKVLGGLVSPTGIGFEQFTGHLYVASLFTGTVTGYDAEGNATVLDEVPFPGDVEAHGGWVYASLTDLANEGGEPAGQVVRWAIVM